MSLQDRLQLKREPIDKWSIREQLCLASAVARSGDQNWMSVSRSLKAFGEPHRPSDWFHLKNCAAQYGALLGNVETPKRTKKRTEVGIETPAESILRRLLAERQAELKRLLAEEKAEYRKLQEDMLLLQSGKVSEDQLNKWCREIDEEEFRREQESLTHSQWLKEREQRKQEIERVWRPVKPFCTIPGQKRKSADTVESILESELEDSSQVSLVQTYQVQHQPQGQIIQNVSTPELAKPALSPLLTSLLKSPSQVPNSVSSSSILHSAITSQRPISNSCSTSNNPTIATLLNTSANVTVSPGLQHLVTSAIGPDVVNSLPNHIPEQQQQHHHHHQHITADMLDDDNLKIDDLANSILVQDGPLPEIKKEEVDELISEIIENAQDIVDDPEQHLELDGNGDININLELDDLDEDDVVEDIIDASPQQDVVNNTQQDVQEAQQEQTQVNEMQVPEIQQVTQPSSSQNLLQAATTPLPTPSGISSGTATPIKCSTPSTFPAVVVPATTTPTTTVDPFEFQEDPVIFEHSLKSVKQDAAKHYYHQTPAVTTGNNAIEEKPTPKLQQNEEKLPKVDEEILSEDQGKAQEVVITLEKPTLKIEIPLQDLADKSDQLNDIKDENTSLVEEEESKDTELGTKSVVNEDVLSKSDKTVDEDTESLLPIKSGEDAIKAEQKCEESDVVTRDDEVIKSDMMGNEEQEKCEGESMGDSFADELYDNISMEVKIDKSGKTKRDYSRTKKRDERFDVLLSLEKSHLDENDFLDDTSSDNGDKKDIKSKLKSETDRSNSPWTEEEDNLRGRRRYSTPATPVDSLPNSPASSIAYFDDDRDYRNWKKSVMLVYSRLASNKYASLFLKPITEAEAPGYNNIVYRPMDLLTIKKNIENGTIRTTLEFKRDVMLMFTNAIMYNKSNDTVHVMAKQMQLESIEIMNVFMQAQAHANGTSFRRETRTSESSSSKRKRTANDDPNKGSKKRKED